ncbi:hypothetical protein BD408DRAFT_139973 [Parasitella parasitica]|nr:hypothetical protein BD408DRAFT_139973 [Parasitella parasitica]
MYNHPIARNFTSTSTNPFTTSPRSDTTPTTNRRLADRLFQEAQREEREEEEEEVTEDEQDRDIISYDVRFEQRTMNDENELDPPDADRTWEASILPQPETESLFQLPFTRFGRLLDTMYNYRSDDDSDEGESNYHRRSFLDNLADILSDYTSEVRQQQTPNTPASTVDAIVKSLKISCLDPSDPAVHDECIICQEMYGSTNEIFHLPCQHKYHGVCITKWFTVNVSCPICRHPADKDQQYEQAQPNQEVHEEQQERQQHSTHPSASTDSAVSTPPLPSSASSSILQGISVFHR